MADPTYLLDTSAFVIIREYYGEIFPRFWEELSKAVRLGKVFSVEQVRVEIENYGGKQKDLLEWIKANEKIFTAPNADEQEIVAKIQEHLDDIKDLIFKGQTQRSNKPVADHFVIARAAYYNSKRPEFVVVTQENARSRKNIPTICKKFGVEAIDLEEFLRRMGWKFK